MNTANQPPLQKSVIYIRNLANCPPSYLNDPSRKEFFEIVWLKDEFPLHALKNPSMQQKGDWIYLIPPYRVHQLNKAGKNGVLLSFKQELLEDEDKEFLLDLFKAFNVQGEFSCLQLTPEEATGLASVYALLEQEYQTVTNSYLIVKALLKVFLLKLMQVKEQQFTSHDVNQKRVYAFFMLLENHYQEVRNIEFYAEQLGISAKRLNQILKENLDKTGMQLIHDRVILEAKRNIIHSERTIKEIAYHLNFSDRPYFSRFFKKQTGQTPEEFQKEVRNHISSKFNTLV
jgi:AraC family transcriptional activator of pobA